MNRIFRRFGDEKKPQGFSKFDRKKNHKQTEEKPSHSDAEQQPPAEEKDQTSDKPVEGTDMSDKKVYDNLQQMIDDINREFEEAKNKIKDEQQKTSDSSKKPQQPDSQSSKPASKEGEKTNKKFITLSEMKDEIERQMKLQMEGREKKKPQDASKKPKQDTSFWKNRDNQKKPKPPQPEPESPWRKYFELAHKYLDKKYPYLIAVIIGLVGYVWLIDTERNIRTVTEEEFFRDYLANGRVKRIVKKARSVSETFSYYVVAETKDGESVKFDTESQAAFTERIHEHFKKNSSHIVMIESEVLKLDGLAKLSRFNSVLSIVLLVLFFVSFINRGGNNKSSAGGMFSGLGSDDFSGFSRSLAKMYTPEQIKTTFSDVAGLQEAKVELQEFVEFLKNPAKFKKLGARIPRGAIMSGPPGTGKTLMAKAVAGEAGVPFFAASGSDFVEVFVGVGAARVRDLFANAKKEGKAIIFIDEIDAIGGKRDGRDGNDEREQTLNQILVEMDGFNARDDIIVFAATNRYDMLDHALVRPGRFDRNVELTLPDLEARRDIFLVHLKKLKLHEIASMEEYARRLATLTPGFSGSDIATICNEAAIFAVRNSKSFVDSTHFEEAVERLIGGVRTSKSLTSQEERTVSYHESGHGVVSWFLRGAMPLLKLTIIPRTKGALGFAQYLPNEDKADSEEDLKDVIASILAGRCSEQYFFGKVTTGAFDDLNKAYDLARKMVTELGMSKELGLMAYSEADQTGKRKFSDSFNQLIDQEIKAIIVECTERCFSVIKANEHKIREIAEKLLELKTLDLRTIVSILGQRPFPLPDSFKEYLTVVEQNDRERETLKSEGEEAVFEHKKELLEDLVQIEEIEAKTADSTSQETKK